MEQFHVPVLLKETLEFLNVRPGEKYIDATLGGGGHTWAIIHAGGKVLGIDQDKEALEYVKSNPEFPVPNSRLVITYGNFAHLKEIAAEANFSQVAGILLDLGLSGYQVESAGRGFSFRQDAPLDMRMDQTVETATAADLLNGLGREELAKLFRVYGEEPFAQALARAIVRQRKTGKITTTAQLAEIVSRVVGKRQGKIHPATLVFQALRIAVNDEINCLKAVLPQAQELLKKDGRLVVISFHSLEDRIVKDYFRGQAVLKVLTEKPLAATPEEIRINPRARSAKLRAAEKTVKE